MLFSERSRTGDVGSQAAGRRRRVSKAGRGAGARWPGHGARVEVRVRPADYKLHPRLSPDDNAVTVTEFGQRSVRRWS